MKSEIEHEDFSKIIAEEELEQFLCCIGLRDDLFNLFLSKGLNCVEKLLSLDQYHLSKSILNENKKELIFINIGIVFDNINEIYSKDNHNNNDDDDDKIDEEENNLNKIIEDNKLALKDENLQNLEGYTNTDNINNEENIKSNSKITKPSFLSIIRNTHYDLKSTLLTKEFIIHSFKLKNKPNNYLPKDFKEEHITADKLYASFLQDKRIGQIENLDGFKNLRHLYLNKNKIQKLDKFNLPNLTILEISDNFIRKLENLELLIHLQNLNIEKNLINKLENIKCNFYLEYINLGRQNLTKFQKFEIDCDNINNENILQNLSLECCNLYDPSKLRIFKNLKKLKINNNKISDLGLIVEGLKNMKELECLFLNNNPFTEINKGFRDIIVIRCPKLEELDNKTITQNEKSYVNSLYSRKFSNKNRNKINNLNKNKPSNSGYQSVKTLPALSVNKLSYLNILEEKKNSTFTNRNKSSN